LKYSYIFNENIDMFKCPVCEDSMYLDESKSIICRNNHCFDISRSGYVNLLLNSVKIQYDKKMFESRKVICNMGFFDPLIKSIILLIDNFISGTKSNKIKVLDAGCGEGFHLSRIIGGIHKKEDVNYQGVGIDISKEGIQTASKNYKGIIWCVADLARIPFKDKQFDIILNILSPSNYGEFNRITGNEGILIKVVPGSDYLKELRKAFYQEKSAEVYSNNGVVEHFGRNLKIIHTCNLIYSVEVSKEEMKHLIKMTPLSWRAADEKVQKVINQGIDLVTADFTIMAGKMKL
jgi:23S rRNA (guanine745-N1)-methyltransferase